MKLQLLTLAFAALAAASPFPWAGAEATPEPTLVPAAPNGTNTTKPTTWHHNPHHEPTPSFKQSCDCPKPIVPIDLLTPAERCEFEYAAAMGCYYRAHGGCPSPTFACPTARK